MFEEKPNENGLGIEKDMVTNRELVERVLFIARAMGRVPYTGQEARELLGVGSG